MPEWEIQRLNRQHDRVNFDCGHLSLNAWLKERAGQFDRKDFSRTFVAVPPPALAVLGYYSLSNHHVVHEVLPF